MWVVCVALGTENVALVTGLGAASRLAMEEGGQLLLHQLTLKQRLIAALVEGFAGEVRPNPHTIRGPSFKLIGL